MKNKKWFLNNSVEKNMFSKKTYNQWIFFLIPWLIFIVLLIILPLILGVLIAINAPVFNKFQLFLEEKISWQTEHLWLFFRTIGIGLCASFIAILIAYPVAYILFRMNNGFFQLNLILLFGLPLLINNVLRVIGLRDLFEMIQSENHKVIGTYWGIIITSVYMFVPFVILPIYNTLKTTNPDLKYVSQDLGTNDIKTFWKITFRYSIPGIISGTTIMFLFTCGSLVITDHIGAYKIKTLATFINDMFVLGWNWRICIYLSLIFLIFLIITTIISNKISNWSLGQNK